MVVRPGECLPSAQPRFSPGYCCYVAQQITQCFVWRRVLQRQNPNRAVARGQGSEGVVSPLWDWTRTCKKVCQSWHCPCRKQLLTHSAKNYKLRKPKSQVELNMFQKLLLCTTSVWILRLLILCYTCLWFLALMPVCRCWKPVTMGIWCNTAHKITKSSSLPAVTTNCPHLSQ